MSIKYVLNIVVLPYEYYSLYASIHRAYYFPYVSHSGVCMEVRQLWLCSEHPSWLPRWGAVSYFSQPPSTNCSSTAAAARLAQAICSELTAYQANLTERRKYPSVTSLSPSHPNSLPLGYWAAWNYLFFPYLKSQISIYSQPLESRAGG